MKTLLIPVDFSETTANVLRYAAAFAKDADAERIILLKSNYVSLYAQLLPSADFVQLNADDIDAEREECGKHLKFLGQKMLKKCNSAIKIETTNSELPLLRALHQVIAEEKPDLVLIGCDADTVAYSSPIGEQVISIVKTSAAPVMVIPSGARYETIRRATIPCDFAAVSRLLLLKELRKSQRWLHPELLVLNIDPGQKHLAHEEEQAEALKEILEDYRYKVYYSDDRDIVSGILDFAGKSDTQLIVALPGRYSFLYNLTHRNITAALALNAKQPVLILK